MSPKTKKIRSENLAVVFTDIVGFTATTASQSRADNASLLHRHDNLLIPIARKFGGRRVKSIGDALLLVFRSSTDALLCAMAMQDALYEHNREHSTEPEIHIRVSVNVGEVRVAKGDVFGEAVNTVARLESITPADAIYLTKAVYMTMNRAEVPVEAVGEHDFKGVDEPVEVYQVPPFTAARLVPEKQPGGPAAKGPREGFSYPYGGVHLHSYKVQAPPSTGEFWRSVPVLVGLGIGLALLLGLLVYLLRPVHPDLAADGEQLVRSVPPPPPPASIPVLPSPGGVVLERIRARVGAAREPLQAFKIEALMEQVWPWLVDEQWFVSPLRLQEASLPLGSPLPDVLEGALPVAWEELPGAEQVLFSSLEDDWGTLEPAFQNRLLKTGRIWRNADPQQRREVIAELAQWREVEGMPRTIAARRLDYLRSLDPDQRRQVIEQKDLAVSLAGSGDGGWVRPPPPSAPAVGVEVQRMPTPAPVPARRQEHPPPPTYDRGPPPGGQASERQAGWPPPPPPEWDGRRPPPPPWEREGGRHPPPPRR